MTLPRRARSRCAFMALGLVFVYVPLVVVLINSFNADRTFAWPPSGFTLRLVDARAAHSAGRARRRC